MRRQQCFQIFVIPHPYPLSGISSSSCCKALPICYTKGLRRFMISSDRGSKVVFILGHGQVLHKYSLPLPIKQFSSLPLLIVLGYALILGLDIGPQAQSFPTRIVLMGSIGPHNNPSKSCFLTPWKKMRILISSACSPYGSTSLGRIITIRVCPPVTRP